MNVVRPVLGSCFPLADVGEAEPKEVIWGTQTMRGPLGLGIHQILSVKHISFWHVCHESVWI